jgi:hypothetical protein
MAVPIINFFAFVAVARIAFHTSAGVLARARFLAVGFGITRVLFAVVNLITGNAISFEAVVAFARMRTGSNLGAKGVIRARTRLLFTVVNFVAFDAVAFITIVTIADVRARTRLGA